MIHPIAPGGGWSNPDCVGHPVADLFHAELMDIITPRYFAPPPGQACTSVAAAASESFLVRLEDSVYASPKLMGLMECPLASMAAWLSVRLIHVASIGANFAGPGYPELMDDRWTSFMLASSAEEMLMLFRSRFPIFSLLAWAHAFLVCRSPFIPDLVCSEAEADVLHTHPLAGVATGHHDATFWEVMLRTAKTVGNMQADVIWINAARVAFDPRVNHDDLLPLAQKVCPVGIATAIAMRGLFMPWGGGHWAGAVAAADALVNGMAWHRLSLHMLMRSPWPLFLLCAQLALRVDHDASSVSVAWAIKNTLQSTKPLHHRVLGSCDGHRHRRASVLVKASQLQLPYLGAWLDMLHATGYRGALVCIVPHPGMDDCLAQAWRAVQGILMHCFAAASATQDHELLIIAHALMERHSDFMLLEFDAILLRDPARAIADHLCSCSQPRPSHLFDRPAGLLEGEPYHSGVRYFRGNAGQALLLTVVQNSMVNPFLRPMQTLGLVTDSHMDQALPEAVFASLDGLRHLPEVALVSNPSPWLASLYRPLVLGDGAARAAQRQKLREARLLPDGSLDFAYSDGTDCAPGAAVLGLQECRAALAQLGITHASEEEGWWDWTPPGCFVHRGCSEGCRLHLGRLALSSNDGRFRAICRLEAGTNHTGALNFARNFALQHADGAEISLRPRLFQIGPSSAGTTSIRDFCQRHGLRTVKSYYRDRDVWEWIEQALGEGRAPLYYVDIYDAYTDFLDPFRARVPWCSSGCEAYFSNVSAVIAGYLHIVSKLASHYPYSKFVYNMRNIEAWLASKSHNCWPEVDQKRDRRTWTEQWARCCDARTDRATRVQCMQSARVPKMPDGAARKGGARRLWASRVCCSSANKFVWIWKKMQAGVESEFAGRPERLLQLKIEDETAARRLSDFLGVEHHQSAWKRSNPNVRL